MEIIMDTWRSSRFERDGENTGAQSLFIPPSLLIVRWVLLAASQISTQIKGKVKKNIMLSHRGADGCCPPNRQEYVAITTYAWLYSYVYLYTLYIETNTNTKSKSKILMQSCSGSSKVVKGWPRFLFAAKASATLPHQSPAEIFKRRKIGN